MSLQRLWQMSYDSKWIDVLRNSKHAIPLIQSLHLFGIVLLLGSIVMLNLRLLGIGLTEIDTRALAKHAWRYGTIGLLLAMVSGFFVFLPDPARYAANKSFVTKMSLLLVAIIFQYTIYRRTIRNQTDSGDTHRRVLLPLLSLTLWFAVGWAGRAIAFLG